MIRRMGDQAALSTAALAAMAAMTGNAGGGSNWGRPGRTGRRAAGTTSPAWTQQIGDREKTIQKINQMRGLVIEEGEADKILAVVIGQVTALEDQKASLLDRLTAAKQKTAAAARAAFEAPFLAGLKGLGLKTDKALLTDDPERRHRPVQRDHSPASRPGSGRRATRLIWKAG